MAIKKNQAGKQDSSPIHSPDPSPSHASTQTARTTSWPAPESSLKSAGHSTLALDDSLLLTGADVNMGGGKSLGGPTGGDLTRGGGGPASGSKHVADNATADHYGSREETNAALEEKIAIQNTRRLHGRP